MIEINDELKSLFEYELKTKLSLKAHSSNSEMILLYNTFRYFDEKNTGLITKEKWPKIFIKLGLTGFSEDDLRNIFNIYDKYKTGLINYQNFIKYIFNKENLEYIKPNFINRYINNNNLFYYNNSFPKGKNSIDNFNVNKFSNTNNINNILIDENNYKTLKRSLSEKNFSPTLKKLFQYLLKQIQNKININNGMTYYTFALKIKGKENKLKETISYEDLCNSILESNILLNMDLIRDFFSILDLCELNSISTNELLRLIRGNINENRKNLITEQFNNINIKNEQWVNTIYLKSIYNSKEHPEVILGRKNENEIFTEFNYTLDIFLNIKKRENKINYKDFIEYYIPISSSIDNDNYFENMIKGVWNIYNPYNNKLNLNYYKPHIISEKNNNNLRYGFNDIENCNNNNFNNTQKYNFYNGLSYNNLNNNYLSKSQKNIFPKINLNNNYNINNNNYNGNNNNDNYNKYYNGNNYNNIKINFNSDNNNSSLKNNNFSKSFSYLRNKIHFNPILNQYIIPEENIELNNQKSNTNILNSYFNQNALINANYQNENNPSENLNIFRNILVSRGKKAIFTFQKIITMYDTFKTGKIDFQSFESICLSYKINLNHNQLYSIFSFFITDDSKKILYEKLFKSLIGNMNNIRVNLVKKVFDKFKKNKFGNIDLIDLKNFYNYKNHPDVILGIKNEKEIYNEFNDNLEIYKNYLNNIYHSNKLSFSLEDFINFYNQISLGIKDDKDFIKLINSVWDFINFEN